MYVWEASADVKSNAILVSNGYPARQASQNSLEVQLLEASFHFAQFSFHFVISFSKFSSIFTIFLV